MPYERDDEPVKDQRQVRPVTRTTSSRIRFYSLLCVGAALASGYMALVGSIADETSKQAIRNFSFGVASLAIIALLVGVLAIAICGLIENRTSSRIMQIGARLFSDIVIAAFLLLLVMSVYAGGNLLLQLGIGQFLLGGEETQYRHLMLLSISSGTVFAAIAGWRSKKDYRLGWWTSTRHGVRVALETAFFAYAGLSLSKEPFEYALGQGKEGNWDIFAIALLGVALIFAGSLSLMFRQSQIRPEVTERVERVPIRTKIRQGFQDLMRVISATKSGIERFIGTFQNGSQCIRTKVQEGGKVEIKNLELEAGQTVDVVVIPIKGRMGQDG